MTHPASTVVRRADPSDGKPVGEVYLLAVRQAMPWLRLAQSDDQVRAWFASEMLALHEVWVVQTGTSLEAFVALSLARDWVDHLYVRPDAQGRGHGGSLLGLAKSRSSGSLSLWAFQRNLRARTFYERRGFRPVHFGDGSTNQEGEPDVRYFWAAVAEPNG